MSKYYKLAVPDWDPMFDRDNTCLSATASSRIRRDLLNLFVEPPFGLFVVGDDSNLQIVHAIIMGVMDTPYEGGFFYFLLKCPGDYPIRPPKVKLMTTDAGRVRFNPNMYHNGKICLSILGTWEGPEWSPAQQLSSLLISIQSLMNDKPYFNEPGFTAESCPGDSQKYTELIRHETLRVAVCGMLENECCLNMPPELRTIMEKSFLNLFEEYTDTVKKHLHRDGQIMIDPFTRMQSKYQYKNILKRLNALYDTLSKKYGDLSTELPVAEEDALSEDESFASASSTSK